MPIVDYTDCAPLNEVLKVSVTKMKVTQDVYDLVRKLDISQTRENAPASQLTPLQADMVAKRAGDLMVGLVDPKATIQTMEDALVTAGLMEAPPAPEKITVEGLDMPESDIPATTVLPIQW